MKALIELCPDPTELLDLEPEKLGRHVLGCLIMTDEPNMERMERATIAKTLASSYHESFRDQIAHAIERALDWLLAQCLLGASPYDQNLMFLTQRGKKAAADYAAEHPVNIA
jgi:hypothetical protein